MTAASRSSKWTAAVLAAFAAAACSSSSRETPPAPPPPAAAEAPPAAPAAPAEPVRGQMGGVVTAQATVTAVDLASRHVTLQRADGAKMTILAGENVRNLPQVKVGDVVTVAYQESIAWEVKKPGEVATPPGSVDVVAGAGRAKEGEKPAAGAGAAMRLTATIVAIDRDTMHVTLKGPDGSLVTFKAVDPAKVARVSVGDMVEIVYTEALAISVTTPDKP
jgi:hypothetical protein